MSEPLITSRLSKVTIWTASLIVAAILVTLTSIYGYYKTVDYVVKASGCVFLATLLRYSPFWHQYFPRDSQSTLGPATLTDKVCKVNAIVWGVVLLFMEVFYIIYRIACLPGEYLPFRYVPSFMLTRTAYYKDGLIELDRGNLTGAIQVYDSALRAFPEEANFYFNRGDVRQRMGNLDEAIKDFNKTIELKPNDSEAFFYRGGAELQKGIKVDALRDANRSIELAPYHPEPYYLRGYLDGQQGDYSACIADFSKAIQLDPKNAGAYNSIAWLKATCPQPEYRDGKAAVEYATKACELTRWKNSNQLDTLAAAYAEAGDFDAAVRWETEYLQSPELSAKLKEHAETRLSLYQSNRPYHAEKYADK